MDKINLSKAALQDTLISVTSAGFTEAGSAEPQKLSGKKTALLFAGQGAHYSGMGQDLYTHNAAAREVFNTVEALSPGISDICFNGTDEQLRQTAHAQPAIFTVDMAAAMALNAAGFKPSMLAGFSLGELAALTYAESFSLSDGFKLVCERGRLMQQASEQNPSVMLAILKLANEQVEELCQQFRHMYPVNYNAPGQLIVAGSAEEAAEFASAVKQAGGRAMPLPVSGGFHCPFMAQAAEGLAEFLTTQQLQEPRLPLFANYTAQPYSGDMRQLLVKQVVNPVRWQSIIQNMAEQGIDTFVEVGPGRTLCNLIAKILPQARALNVEDTASLNKTLEELA